MRMWKERNTEADRLAKLGGINGSVRDIHTQCSQRENLSSTQLQTCITFQKPNYKGGKAKVIAQNKRKATKFLIPSTSILDLYST